MTSKVDSKKGRETSHECNEIEVLATKQRNGKHEFNKEPKEWVNETEKCYALMKQKWKKCK